MRFRLIHKLLIALFASAALVLLLILWVAKVNIGRGFEDFLAEQERVLMPQLANALGNWYGERGGWSELQQNPRSFHRMLNSILVDQRRGLRNVPDGQSESPDASGLRSNILPRTRGSNDRHRHARPARDDGAFHRRVFLLDTNYSPVIGHSSRQFPRDNLIPVESNGVVVGWLGVESPHAMLAPAEQAFMDRMKRVLLLGLVLGLGVAALLAWILARHLGQPVSMAADGIRKLAEGDFDAIVETGGSDEIAQLGTDVNLLAQVLSENRSARQRWMADMAHELRTPLAIIQGELEAIRDGVRPMNEKSLASIEEEVSSLSKLIEDLNHLALSDSGALSYEMKFVNLSSLVEASVDANRARAEEKGIVISVTLPTVPVRVVGDDQRLRQLVRILMDNAILYTDAPGFIDISLNSQGDIASLVVDDSPPGVPESDCERLFERLYRREGSRNRNLGGSGLGLAIARNIAGAHGGSITASPGPLGGLRIHLTVPLQT